MSSRRTAGRRGVDSKAKGALSALEAALNEGRANTFTLKEEEDVYDVVEEEEYGKIVHRRREEHGAFLFFFLITITITITVTVLVVVQPHGARAPQNTSSPPPPPPPK